MRLTDIFEAKKVWDTRHPERPDIPYWPKDEDPRYIAPENGFHFHFHDGQLILHSVENAVYSNHVVNGDDPSNASPASSFWNQMSGLVDLKNKVVTIAKENYGQGSAYRLRNIADVRAFQQLLKDLCRHGVTPDFKLKNVSANIPKTVGAALAIEDPRTTMHSGGELILYHGTSKSRLEAIMKKGLRPGNTPDVYNDLVPQYSEFNVYLATTLKNAMFYGRRQAKKDHEYEYVVLEVRVPDPAKIVADDYPAKLKGGWRDEAEAPEDRTKRMRTVGGSGPALSMSFKGMGEVGYRGVILPMFIKLAKTYKI